MPTFICKFNKDYETFIKDVYEYVVATFAQDFKLSSLKEIEIVESIPSGGDGRMVDANTIHLSKKLYDLLPILDIKTLNDNENFKLIVSTLYHELCHINERTILPNLHSICDKGETNIEYCIALFWIEFIVELKTNIALKRNKDEFCNEAAFCEWKINKFNFEDKSTSNYFYLIKVLSYTLANCYSQKNFAFFNKFKNFIVRNMAVELNDVVSNILKSYPFDDIEKLYKIKDILLSYEKQLVK